MFTIKHRFYELASEQPPNGPGLYDQREHICGPFVAVSQVMEDGYIVVRGENGERAPAYTFGPHRPGIVTGPRPHIWVMNETGATVATYDL